MTKKKGEAPTVGAVDASRPAKPVEETPASAPGASRTRDLWLRRPNGPHGEVDGTLAPTPDARALALELSGAVACIAAWERFAREKFRCGGCPDCGSADCGGAPMPWTRPPADFVASVMAEGKRAEDLAGALEDVLKAWDHYQELLDHSLPGIEGEPPLVAAENGLEAELEGARIVLQATSSPAPSPAAELVDAEEKARARCGQDLARMVLKLDLARPVPPVLVAPSPKEVVIVPATKWERLCELAGDGAGRWPMKPASRENVLVEVHVRRPWRAVRSFNCSLCGDRVHLGALDFEGALKKHMDDSHPQLDLLTGGRS